MKYQFIIIIIIIEHKIEVTSEKPIRLRAYRATPAARAEIDRQLDEMLENGILSESDSPWSAPVLLVKKANGDQRLAIDYRQLNLVTKDRFQSLPTMDEIIDGMAEKHFFVPRFIFWVSSSSYGTIE